jgi:glycosyltransferase involved in cell wall biosynthesis
MKVDVETDRGASSPMNLSKAPTPILLLARQLDVGGTERQLTEIAKSIDRARFTPHVGCYRAEGLRTEELRAAGIPVFTIPVKSLWSPGTLGAAARMGRYMNRHGIELVHTFDTPMNLFGVPAARMFRAPRVISSQRASRSLTPPLARKLLRITDRLSDGVVVNCRELRRHLIEDERVPPSRIHLCYNGIDTAQFHLGERRSAGPVVIGVVCALRPEKGLGTLLEAFARLRRDHADLDGAQLLIVGSGPARAELEALSRDLGIASHCRFEPAQSQVAQWLRRIDIFVLPSFSEALSNSLMEAMACGCAVIASRVGGNPELVEHGRTGLLFEPGAPAALASALELLVRNETMRRELAAAAARFIHATFPVAAAVRRMEEIYSTVLAPPIP